MRDVPVLDAPELDAPLADGEVRDTPAGDAGTFACARDGEVIELATDTSGTDRVVSLAAGASSFGLTWSQSVDGLPEIHAASIGATGGATIRQITSLSSRVQSPAIVASGTGWLLAWVGNQVVGAGFEIFAQALAADLSPTAPQRLTENAVLDASPTLAALPTSGFVVAWTESGDGSNTAIARLVASSGAPSAPAIRLTAAGTRVERPALATRSAGLSMTWAETAADPPQAHILGLDAAGMPQGTVGALSTEGNADGATDVTMDATGGAAVFGVLVGGARREVRLRLLDETGVPAGEEHPATPSSGGDASVAAYGGGYLVAYRAADGEHPIRVALVDAVGVFLTELDVASAAESGGRTTIRVTTDGRVLVAWVDRVGSESHVRAARIRCE